MLMTKYEVHPVANVVPSMTDDAFQRLKADIKEHGQQEPAWLWDGKIIDGRHRYQACKDLDKELKTREWHGDESDLLPFVLSANLHRRHLNSAQRAALAVAVEEYEAEKAKERREATQIKDGKPPVGGGKKSTTEGKGKARKKAAEAAGTNPRYVSDAKRIKDDAPDVFDRMQGGSYDTMAEAKRVAKLPEKDRSEIHDLVDTGKAEDTKTANQMVRKRQTEQRAEELERKAAEVPDGLYQCIVIDPPWPMEKIKRKKRANQAGFDYPTMTEAELREFPLPDIAAKDCHLYLWTTHKFMPMALRLAEHWGFRYQCIMTWVKNVGFTPFSWMYSTEHVLFCRKGSLKLKQLGMRLDFDAKVREHSRKPDVFYETVARASPEPRIDVFSREARDGFDQFGNETEVMNDA